MGKCAKCGKKIEYNSFTVIDGIVYHPNCAPKKEVDPEVVKAELEAEEQFERTMERHGTLDNYAAFKEQIKEEKKPRKKRSKKGNKNE
jgi:hypothetical protein